MTSDEHGSSAPVHDPCAGYSALRLSVVVARTPIALQSGANGGFHIGVLPGVKGTLITLSPGGGLCPPCALHQVGLLRGRLSRTLGVAGLDGRGVPRGTPPGAPLGPIVEDRWAQYHVFTTCLTGPRGGIPEVEDACEPAPGCSGLHRRMAALHGGGIPAPNISEFMGYIAGTASEVDSPVDFPTVLASSMAQFQQQGVSAPSHVPQQVLRLDFTEDTFDALYGPMYGHGPDDEGYAGGGYDDEGYGA